MYIPPHFEQLHTDAIHRLIREYPLATLVISYDEGLTADHNEETGKKV
jgi:transcriptional regulator